MVFELRRGGGGQIFLKIEDVEDSRAGSNFHKKSPTNFLIS
jgi:hypothetical protein